MRSIDRSHDVRIPRRRFLALELDADLHHPVDLRHVSQVVETRARLELLLLEQPGFADEADHAGRPGDRVRGALGLLFSRDLQRLALHHTGERQRLVLADPLPHRRDQHFTFRGLDGRFLAELHDDLAEAIDGEALVLGADPEFLAVLLDDAGVPVEVAEPFALDGGDKPVIEEEFLFLSRGLGGDGWR